MFFFLPYLIFLTAFSMIFFSSFVKPTALILIPCSTLIPLIFIFLTSYFFLSAYIIFLFQNFVNTFFPFCELFLLIFFLSGVIVETNKELGGETMTQGERVKELRKSLSLTLERFGQRIGVGKSTISDIENGRRSLSEHMTKSICREFGVDYIWLTTGDGEMFVESDDDFMERIDRIMVSENEVRKNMIKTLLYASDTDIECLDSLINYYISLRGGSN